MTCVHIYIQFVAAFRLDVCACFLAFPSSLPCTCCQWFLPLVFGEIHSELVCLDPPESASLWASWLSFRPTEGSLLHQCSFLPQAILFKLHLCPAPKTLQDSQCPASQVGYIPPGSSQEWGIMVDMHKLTLVTCRSASGISSNISRYSTPKVGLLC